LQRVVLRATLGLRFSPSQSGILMRLLALMLFLAATLLSGCGPAAAAKKPAKKKTTTVAVRPAPQAPQVDQNAYADVAAAMADVESVAGKDADETNKILLKVETWLNMQGARIAPELETLIKDKAAGLRTRLTACRVLTRLGPVSVPTLLVALEDETQQLRLKAVECLGRVKPTSAEVVSRLVALLDDQDYEIRKGAFRAITVVGPPAKQHDPQLVEKLTNTLNDLKEDETIRSLAHDALKKIDPRKGLMGVEKG
jgi:HEAT repeat protein